MSRHSDLTKHETSDVVVRERDQSVRSFQVALARAAARTHRVLCQGGTVLTNASGRFERVTDAASFAAFLGLVTTVNEDGRHVAPGVSDARALLTSADLQKCLPQVRLVTRIPMLCANWRPCAPGYNTASRIFVDATSDASRALSAFGRIENLEPLTSPPKTGRLSEWLDAIAFRTPADRARYLGALLSLFALHRFPGDKPLVLLEGNRPGVGKTTAARAALALLGDHEESASVTLARRDVDVARSIHAAMSAGRAALLFDNVRLPEGAHVDLPTLERVLTDEFVDCPTRGGRPVRLRNDLLLLATWNGGRMTEDLAHRTLRIRLHVEGDPRHRTASEAGEDLPGFVRRHRARLYVELLAMWDRWDRAGRPRSTEPFRFSRWASLIGGVLKANGIDGPIMVGEEPDGSSRDPIALPAAGELSVATDRSTIQRSEDEVDAALGALAAIAVDEWLSASGWAARCRERGLLPDLLGRGERAAVTALGKHLACRVSRGFRVRNEELTDRILELRSRRRRNGTEYSIVACRVGRRPAA